MIITESKGNQKLTIALLYDLLSFFKFLVFSQVTVKTTSLTFSIKFIKKNTPKITRREKMHRKQEESERNKPKFT